MCIFCSQFNIILSFPPSMVSWCNLFTFRLNPVCCVILCLKRMIMLFWTILNYSCKLSYVLFVVNWLVAQICIWSKVTHSHIGCGKFFFLVKLYFIKALRRTSQSNIQKNGKYNFEIYLSLLIISLLFKSICSFIKVQFKSVKVFSLGH